MKKKSKKTPGRERYDMAKPVISVRVDRALYDGLKMLSKMGNKSMAAIFREALGKQMPYTLGAYWQGYNEAMARYTVHYPCGHCGGDMIVETEQFKHVVTQLIVDAGWMHSSCVPAADMTFKLLDKALKIIKKSNH